MILDVVKLSTLFFQSFLESYRGLSSIAWHGILIAFLESILVGTCYFLSFYFMSELHFDAGHASMLMTFYGIGTVCGSFISGRLTDQLTPGIIVIISLFLQAFSYAGLAFITNAYLIMFLLFLIGLGAYGFITANYAWVLAYCRRGEMERLKAINLLSVASNFGLGFSAMLIGAFMQKSFTPILIGVSFLLFIIASYLIFYTKKIKPPHEYGPPENTMASGFVE